MRAKWPALALMIVVAVGCAGESPRVPDPEPGPEYVALVRLGSNGETLGTALTAKLVEAGIDARMMPVQDLPEAWAPAWLTDRESGWVVLVKNGRVAEARTVQGAWIESLGAAVREETAAAPPPFVFGRPEPMAADAIEGIRDELDRRVRIDQAVRTDPARRAEMKAVDADNTAWLKRTTKEHGWIDAARFGARAANAAFLLVQHSGDRALMAAALPEIERDVKAGRLNAQNFALLYDRTQIMQGGRQRYGTQVMKDSEKGDWVVGRLEDPDRVDERRKALGLEPLADYLARFDHEVRIDR